MNRLVNKQRHLWDSVVTLILIISKDTSELRRRVNPVESVYEKIANILEAEIRYRLWGGEFQRTQKPRCVIRSRGFQLADEKFTRSRVLRRYYRTAATAVSKPHFENLSYTTTL